MSRPEITNRPAPRTAARRRDAHPATRQAPRGVTLVEVLVVLVILVIGIFAITRLFPQGFASIGFSGTATVANALAKYNEDYMRKNRERLPEGIAGLDPVTGALRPTLTPEDLQVSRPYVGGQPAADDPRFSDVNQARRVFGEHFKLPPAAVYEATGETVSLYRALFSPIYSAAPAIPAAQGIDVTSATPLERVNWPDPPEKAHLDQLISQYPQADLRYAVNADAGYLYFLAADYPRTYNVRLSYRDQNGVALQTAPGSAFLLPADQPPVLDPATNQIVSFRVQRYNLAQGAVDQVLEWVATSEELNVLGGSGQQTPFFQLPAGSQVEPDTDYLYRKFDLIAGNQPFGADPYDYKVYDTVSGLLGFHPNASALALPSQQQRGLTARMDYDVDDWHILRQDVVVPTEVVDLNNAGQPLHAIKLLTPGIKQLNDIEDTVNLFQPQASAQTTFEYLGLVRNQPGRAGTPGMDVLIADLETGMVVDSITLDKLGDNTNGEIDYQAGVIHLRPQVSFRDPAALPGTPGAAPRPVAGRSLRVYYRTANDYAVATFKPWSDYFRQVVQPVPGEREFVQAPNGYLLFPFSDWDKTLTVDYTWRRQNGSVASETGELQKVQRPGLIGDPGMNTGWIQLARAADPDLDTADPNAIQIRGVRGASFHTRIIWRDSNRWRQVHRSTLLNREATR